MSTAINTVTLTTANTEYNIHLGTIKTLTIGCRTQLGDLRIQTVSGKVATPAEPYLLVHYSSKQTLSFSPATDVTLYLAGDVAGVVAEIISH
ncbi:MAG TPA: hypothetical protein VGJ15_07925 [Pirellulales bacterium]|jgi:hypothetical protein